ADLPEVVFPVRSPDDGYLMTTAPTRRSVLLAGALASLVMTAPSIAQDERRAEADNPQSPRVLVIDDQFNATHARLVSVDSSGITVEASCGTRSRLAPRSVLALISTHGPIDPEHGIGSVVPSKRVESTRAPRIGQALAASLEGYLETV